MKKYIKITLKLTDYSLKTCMLFCSSLSFLYLYDKLLNKNLQDYQMILSIINTMIKIT